MIRWVRPNVVTAADTAAAKLAANSAIIVAEDAAKVMTGSARKGANVQNTAESTGRLVNSQADTVMTSSRGVPSNPAYDVVSQSSPASPARSGRISEASSAMSQGSVKTKTTTQTTKPGYIDQSHRGQMPIPGPSNPVRQSTRPKPAQPPKPKSVPQANPNQQRMSDLKTKIKNMKKLDGGAMFDQRQLSKWQNELENYELRHK